MNDMNEALKKLEALDASEVSKADRAILEFCISVMKKEKENTEMQEVMFSAVLQALGRRLGIDEEELKGIYLDTKSYIIEHWDEISKQIEDDEQFARIISGIVEDKEGEDQ